MSQTTEFKTIDTEEGTEEDTCSQLEVFEYLIAEGIVDRDSSITVEANLVTDEVQQLSEMGWKVEVTGNTVTFRQK